MIRRFSFLLVLAAAVCSPAVSYGQFYIMDTFDDASNSSLTRPGGPVGPQTTITSSVASEFNGRRALDVNGSPAAPSATISVNSATGLLSYTGNNSRTGDVIWTPPTPGYNMMAAQSFGFEMLVSAISDPSVTMQATLYVYYGGNLIPTTLTAGPANFTQASLAIDPIWKPLFTDFGTPGAFAAVDQIILEFSTVGSNPATISIDYFAAVPEPSTWALLGAVALVGGGRFGWKRLKRNRKVVA